MPTQFTFNIQGLSDDGLFRGSEVRALLDSLAEALTDGAGTSFINAIKGS